MSNLRFRKSRSAPVRTLSYMCNRIRSCPDSSLFKGALIVIIFFAGPVDRTVLEREKSESVHLDILDMLDWTLLSPVERPPKLCTLLEVLNLLICLEVFCVEERANELDRKSSTSTLDRLDEERIDFRLLTGESQRSSRGASTEGSCPLL